MSFQYKQTKFHAYLIYRTNTTLFVERCFSRIDNVILDTISRSQTSFRKFITILQSDSSFLDDSYYFPKSSMNVKLGVPNSPSISAGNELKVVIDSGPFI